MLTMKDRLLEVGQNLLITFPVVNKKLSDGSTIVTSKIFFFKVAAWYPLVRLYDKLGPLSTGESKEGYLGDEGIGQGKDVLRIASDDFHVYHVFVAPQDPSVRIYKTITPVGDVESAFSYKASVDYAKVDKGSPFDFYTLKEAGDKFNPNQIAENIIFRAGDNDDGQYFIWGFYALDDIPDDYKLYLLGRGYKIIPVTDKNEQQAMLKQMSMPSDKREVKTTAIQVGGLNRIFGLEEFVPKSWLRVGNYVDYQG